MTNIHNIIDGRMFTVSCYDSIFGSLTNDGSYLTLAQAIKGAEQSKQRCPKTRKRYRIHSNPRGMGYVNDYDVVLSLLF